MKSKISNSQSGMATIETIPLLMVFVIFVGYGVGSFGIIHTGILNSIASRAYAFETFRHRPQLRYFRDEAAAVAPRGQYYKGGTRVHGIQSEAATNESFIYATERGISRGLASNNGDIEKSRQESLHKEIDDAFAGEAFNGRYTRQGTTIAWIKVYYGICLDAGCGD